MTRKDFRALASILRRTQDSPHVDRVEAFILYLRADNPSFDPEVFRLVAGVGPVLSDMPDSALWKTR